MSILVAEPTIGVTANSVPVQDAGQAERGIAVDSAKIHYYGRSFGDPVSRLFWHGGELHLGVLTAARTALSRFHSIRPFPKPRQ